MVQCDIRYNKTDIIIGMEDQSDLGTWLAFNEAHVQRWLLAKNKVMRKTYTILPGEVVVDFFLQVNLRINMDMIYNGGDKRIPYRTDNELREIVNKLEAYGYKEKKVKEK